MPGRMGRTQESLGSAGDTSLIGVKTHKYCSGQVTLGSGDNKAMKLHTTGTPSLDNLKNDLKITRIIFKYEVFVFASIFK